MDLSLRERSTRKNLSVQGSYHGPVCDQSDQGVRGNETQADDDGVAQGFEVILIETRIDHEQKNGRNLSGACKGVFNCSVFWQQLRGQICVGDVFVVRGKRVARKTERANP
jgi:hypothetical protein